MSLFSNEDFNTVFPEAKPETLVNSSNARYEHIAEEYSRKIETSGRLSITNGAEDVIGELLETSNEHSNDIDFDIDTIPVDNGFKNVLKTSILNTKKMVENLFPYDSIDASKDIETYLSKIVWSIMEEAYDDYEQLELEPELIIFYEGNTPEFWEILFKKLGQYQLDSLDLLPTDSMILNSKYGLKINPTIKEVWYNSLLSKSPKWQMAIISGNDEPIIKKVNHDGVNHLTRKLSKSIWNLTDIQWKVNGSNKLVHPTIESYLTIQAIRLMNGKPGIDYGTYSWLNGEYIFDDTTQSPIATLGKTIGSLSIDLVNSNTTANNVGIRPFVRY